MPRFKKGDRAKIVKRVNYAEGWDNDWADEMDQFIGMTFEIFTVDEDSGIYFEDEEFDRDRSYMNAISGYSFPPESLELVEEESMPEKIEIVAQSIEFDIIKMFDGKDIPEACAQLVSLKAFWSPEHNVRLRLEKYGYDGAFTPYLDIYRLETDREYLNRIEAEQKIAEKVKKRKADKLEKALEKIELAVADYKKLLVDED